MGNWALRSGKASFMEGMVSSFLGRNNRNFQKYLLKRLGVEGVLFSMNERKLGNGVCSLEWGEVKLIKLS